MQDDCSACPLDQIETVLERKRLGNNRFVIISLKDLNRIQELSSSVFESEDASQVLHDCRRVWGVISQIRLPRKDPVFLADYTSLLLVVASHLGVHLQDEELKREVWQSLNLERILLLAPRLWLIGNEPVLLRIVFSVASLYSLFKEVASEYVICKCYELASEALLIGDMSLSASEWEETRAYCENIESAFLLRRRDDKRFEENDEEDDLYHHHAGDGFDLHEMPDPLEEEMFLESLVHDTIAEAISEVCATYDAAHRVSTEIASAALGLDRQASIDYFYDDVVGTDDGEESVSSENETDEDLHEHLYEDAPSEAPVEEYTRHSVFDAKTDFERRFGKNRDAKAASTDIPVIVAKPENVFQFRRQPLFNFHALSKERTRPNFGIPVIPPGAMRVIPKMRVEHVDEEHSEEVFSC
ncbi:hypothetical protein QR680_008268 [Steinernema hermaphroditum]|uniref:Uncharacterized protein n=1 Tax=Steinernema hermaphroditum TaxID=289476 RepID=A0AA39II67_9BILA|nr:hypothetical protein QR680_008268 [Steinernema hermaphroditum]